MYEIRIVAEMKLISLHDSESCTLKFNDKKMVGKKKSINLQT